MMKILSSVFVGCLVLASAALGGCAADASSDTRSESVGTTHQALTGGDYQDPIYPQTETECTVATLNGKTSATMHCCPQGAGLVGVDVDHNIIECNAGLWDVTEGPPFLDTGTQCSDGKGGHMHCCPPGTAMVGLEVNENYLACAKSNDAPYDSTYYDGPGFPNFTQTGSPDTMHVCFSATEFGYSNGWLMQGIEVNENTFLCVTFDDCPAHNPAGCAPPGVAHRHGAGEALGRIARQGRLRGLGMVAIG